MIPDHHTAHDNIQLFAVGYVTAVWCHLSCFHLSGTAFSLDGMLPAIRHLHEVFRIMRLYIFPGLQVTHCFTQCYDQQKERRET